MDYPRELLQIQVLDDSTDDTHPYTQRLVGEYQAAGFPIEYIHRQNRHGYKAGALQNGLKTATGEIVAIFDADFVPPTDFLQRAVHYFADPKVGMVQTRWTYLNRHYNVLTEVQAMLLDGHFVLEHVARFGGGLFFNFNGTAGILRRSMIEDAGGWQHDTLTEDFRPQLSRAAQGLEIRLRAFYRVPLGAAGRDLRLPGPAIALGERPDAGRDEAVADDSTLEATVAREGGGVLSPDAEHFLPADDHRLRANAAVMIVRFYMGWFQMLVIDTPLIAASFWSISAFYIIAHRELFPKNWKRAFVFLPALMAAGVALTIINSRAVFEALIGYQTAFARTPKYAIGGEQKVHLENIQYRRGSGWLPYAEMAVGTYFLGMVIFAITSYNFLAVPFLLLFVGGYYWAAGTTLWQEYQGKLQWQRQRELAEVVERAEA